MLSELCLSRVLAGASLDFAGVGGFCLFSIQSLQFFSNDSCIANSNLQTVAVNLENTIVFYIMIFYTIYIFKLQFKIINQQTQDPSRFCV